MSNVIHNADPKAVYDLLDYGFDFTDWLDGDTIVSATWTVPSPLVNEQVSQTTFDAVVWLSGGVAGTSYEVLCRIITLDGRHLEIGFLLPVV